MNTPPEAVFDTLVVCDELTDMANGATSREVMRFAYLACILSIYRNQEPSEWGYAFSALGSQAPYSPEIAAALEELAPRGWISRDDDLFRMSDAGRSHLHHLSELTRFSSRLPLVRTSCASMLTLPLPQVGRAISLVSEIWHARFLASTRKLLGQQTVEELASQLDTVREVMPATSDLLVPSMVWLSYLASQDDDIQHDDPVEFRNDIDLEGANEVR